MRKPYCSDLCICTRRKGLWPSWRGRWREGACPPCTGSGSPSQPGFRMRRGCPPDHWNLILKTTTKILSLLLTRSNPHAPATKQETLQPHIACSPSLGRSTGLRSQRGRHCPTVVPILGLFFNPSGFFIYSCSYLSVRPGAVLLRREEEIAAYFNVIGLHLSTALVEMIQENLYNFCCLKRDNGSVPRKFPIHMLTLNPNHDVSICIMLICYANR